MLTTSVSMRSSCPPPLDPGRKADTWGGAWNPHPQRIHRLGHIPHSPDVPLLFVDSRSEKRFDGLDTLRKEAEETCARDWTSETTSSPSVYVLSTAVCTAPFASYRCAQASLQERGVEPNQTTSRRPWDRTSLHTGFTVCALFENATRRSHERDDL